MAKLRTAPARPRRTRLVPSYPRSLGVGVIALVAACGGYVESEGESSPTTTTSTSSPPPTTSTTTGSGGPGGEGGQAGEGGHGWGGEMSGFAPPPYGGGGVGGGVGGHGDSAS